MNETCHPTSPFARGNNTNFETNFENMENGSCELCKRKENEDIALIFNIVYRSTFGGDFFDVKTTSDEFSAASYLNISYEKIKKFQKVIHKDMLVEIFNSPQFNKLLPELFEGKYESAKIVSCKHTELGLTFAKIFNLTKAETAVGEGLSEDKVSILESMNQLHRVMEKLKMEIVGTREEISDMPDHIMLRLLHHTKAGNGKTSEIQSLKLANKGLAGRGKNSNDKRRLKDFKPTGAGKERSIRSANASASVNGNGNDSGSGSGGVGQGSRTTGNGNSLTTMNHGQGSSMESGNGRGMVSGTSGSGSGSNGSNCHGSNASHGSRSSGMGQQSDGSSASTAKINKKKNHHSSSKNIMNKSKLPKKATDVLKSWFLNNINHPYPNVETKDMLCKMTNLTKKQIQNWFTNSRKRFLEPLKKKLDHHPHSIPMGQVNLLATNMNQPNLQDTTTQYGGDSSVNNIIIQQQPVQLQQEQRSESSVSNDTRPNSMFEMKPQMQVNPMEMQPTMLYPANMLNYAQIDPSKGMGQMGQMMPRNGMNNPQIIFQASPQQLNSMNPYGQMNQLNPVIYGGMYPQQGGFMMMANPMMGNPMMGNSMMGNPFMLQPTMMGYRPMQGYYPVNIVQLPQNNMQVMEQSAPTPNNTNQMPTQMPTQLPNQTPNQMSNQMPNQMQNQLPGNVNMVEMRGVVGQNLSTNYNTINNNVFNNINNLQAEQQKLQPLISQPIAIIQSPLFSSGSAFEPNLNLKGANHSLKEAITRLKSDPQTNEKMVTESMMAKDNVHNSGSFQVAGSRMNRPVEGLLHHPKPILEDPKLGKKFIHQEDRQ
jgi:hypothetical protein